MDAQACVTSADCGALKCVEERCVDVDAFTRGDLQRVGPTDGWHAMFGSGHDYRLAVLIGDIAAASTVPVLAVLALSGQSLNGFFAVAAIFPTTLTGPIIHAVNGRAVPTIISFFGWASVVPTTIGMNAVGQILACCNNSSSGPVSGMLAFGISAVAGAALMTTLDVYMARRVDAPIQWIPSIAPTRDGAMLSVRGAW